MLITYINSCGLVTSPFSLLSGTRTRNNFSFSLAVICEESLKSRDQHDEDDDESLISLKSYFHSLSFINQPTNGPTLVK